jgi:hypothetical protein
MGIKKLSAISSQLSAKTISRDERTSKTRPAGAHKKADG